MLSRLKHILFNPPSQPGSIPKEYIKGYLPKHPVVLEAGAHAGHDTREMATKWKGAEIHAFEPVPQLWKSLCRNTAMIPNVYRYPFALSSEPGLSWCELYLSEGVSDASSSILEPKAHLRIHPNVIFQKKLKIPAISIDSWAMAWQIPRVDFIWLDLQGYELQALSSAEVVLNTVSAIYCEVNLIETYHGAALYSELRTWLGKRGFVVNREEIPWEDGGNVLFVRCQKKKLC